MMKLPAIFLVFFTAACVTTGTPYQAQTHNYGYKDVKIENNEFTVSFSGDANTSQQQVKDFVLLRSAEVILDNGFKYFSVIKWRWGIKKMGSTLMLSNGYDSAPMANSTMITSKPRLSYTIRAYDKEPKNVKGFEAVLVKAFLVRKYELTIK